MALSVGSRLGPYEVAAEIGAGGMGIVYRARDTKLQRDVALKVLPDLIATGSSPDGKSLLFAELPAASPPDIGLLSMEGQREAKMLIQTEFTEGAPVVSPDGQWIAYNSNLSGRAEIYVQRFPSLGERQQVSTDGALRPFWSADGRELYFRSLDGRQVLAVSVESGAALRVARPEVLFEGSYFLGTGADRSYHIAPDGRFVMIKIADATTEGARGAGPDVILVQNWAEELKRLVGR